MRIKLRNMKFSRSAASDLDHISLVPEVNRALSKWIKGKTEHLAPGVLIGGLALSFYSPPRETTDIDLLFLSDEQIPEKVDGFKRHRPHGFEEKKTQVEVEVEVFTPSSIGIPRSVADRF